MREPTEELRERRARGHSGRVVILDFLCEEARGLSVEEIQASLPLELTGSRIEYHLKVLVANGLVVRQGRSYTALDT